MKFSKENQDRERVLVLSQPSLSEEELAGAFAIVETDIRMRAILQVISSLEREAIATAQIKVGNPPVSNSCLGGAEHLAILRDTILAYQQKGFGKKP